MKQWGNRILALCLMTVLTLGSLFASGYVVAGAAQDSTMSSDGAGTDAVAEPAPEEEESDQAGDSPQAEIPEEEEVPEQEEAPEEEEVPAQEEAPAQEAPQSEEPTRETEASPGRSEAPAAEEESEETASEEASSETSAAETSAAAEEEPPARENPNERLYEDDFVTVTVRFDETAEIPDDAELSVRRITEDGDKKDRERYQKRLKETKAWLEEEYGSEEQSAGKAQEEKTEPAAEKEKAAEKEAEKENAAEGETSGETAAAATEEAEPAAEKEKAAEGETSGETAAAEQEEGKEEGADSAEKNARALEAFELFDISFIQIDEETGEEREIEPMSAVRVTVSFKSEDYAVDQKEEDTAELMVCHFMEDGRYRGSGADCGAGGCKGRGGDRLYHRFLLGICRDPDPEPAPGEYRQSRDNSCRCSNNGGGESSLQKESERKGVPG